MLMHIKVIQKAKYVGREVMFLQPYFYFNLPLLIHWLTAFINLNFPTKSLLVTYRETTLNQR